MVVANRQHDAIAIGRGRQAGFRFEEPAEVADIAKAERVGNLLDRQGRAFPPQPCFMDGALLDQLTRRIGELATADVVNQVLDTIMGIAVQLPALKKIGEELGMSMDGDLGDVTDRDMKGSRSKA